MGTVRYSKIFDTYVEFRIPTISFLDIAQFM